MTITFYDAENNEIDMMSVYDCCDSELMQIARDSAPSDTVVRFEVDNGFEIRSFDMA